MTEKQLFYPLLSVYFSLILGDLQKEKLQIVSIFRFGHKKRGLFQCPLADRRGRPRGRVAADGKTRVVGAKVMKSRNITKAMAVNLSADGRYRHTFMPWRV